MGEPTTFVEFDEKKSILVCSNAWDLAHYPEIQAELKKIRWPKQGTLLLDGQLITKMDTSGVWLLNQWVKKLSDSGLKVQLKNFSSQAAELMVLVEKKSKNGLSITVPPLSNQLVRLGHYSVERMIEGRNYLNFVGKLSFQFVWAFLNPFRWRWNEVAGVIQKTGIQALPIIALLSFMIGVVISYQMGNQLRAYGANVFIVDLLGLSVLREFGPLITAILVAGRTGSAYTAQLGIMKINQEIDALDTLGVAPGELLIIPRIVGLAIVMPLLTIWADIFGIIGGMVMANTMLGISWYDFLQRFQYEIPLRALLIGIGKAPVFALIIASIACFQGMQVIGSSESVGRLTTRSVVLAIFFIIVADAVFSVIFSKFQL